MLNQYQAGFRKGRGCVDHIRQTDAGYSRVFNQEADDSWSFPGFGKSLRHGLERRDHRETLQDGC